MKAEVCSSAPTSWVVQPIRDVCTHLTSGGTPRRSRADFYGDGEWPWVKTKELADSWIDDTEEHITAEGVRQSSAKVLPPNTVLLALYGATVGQLGLLRRPMTCNQACCAMIVDETKADFRYLFYQLLGARNQLRDLAVGAAQQNLSGELIRSFEIPFPTLEEQSAIAGVLASLDDKIDLNRRMNETLESSARTIFRSWFIDFEPVREAATVPGEIHRILPDRLVDSPLGPMPEGWEVGPLTELMTVNRESVDPRNHPQELFDHYSLPAFDAGRVPASERGADIKSSKLRVADGCVLLSKLNPRIPRVWWPSSSGRLRRIASTEFVVALPRDYFTRSYLFGLFTSARFRSTLTSLVRGTSGSHQRVSVMDLLDLEVSIPPRPLVDHFDAIVAPMFDQQEALTAESKTLAELRDTLLPKLMSGEITVGGTSQLERVGPLSAAGFLPRVL